ncbi:MAG TPA: hypothetical protein VK633_05860, partial [Verrucomicrobiae bacterium]|nr:hypothetical protein [Verrucomicrobiae bacterium]
IEPGTTVLFNQGLSLNVDGRLLAAGEETNRIRFTRNSGVTSWNRIDFRASALESRIAYADIDGASAAGNIRGRDMSIVLDHINFTNTLQQLVTLDDSSCVIQFCHFPSIQNNELIHFHDMPSTGHALIANCLFGTPGIPATSGYNDIVDFTGGNRPGPIVEFIGNIFLSSVDDCFDMDSTDAHIEGNIFINVRQDAQRDSGSYPITTGVEGPGTSQLVVCRNIIYDCEHFLLIKDRGAILAQNNTILRLATNTAARTDGGAQIPPGLINFSEPWRGTAGGDGAYVEGNIAADLKAPALNFYTNSAMFLVVNQSLIQGQALPGLGNLTGDPQFVSPSNLTYLNIRSNLALALGSPCIGTGPNGLDMGALVPAGASVSGEPASPTTSTSAILRVAGPGIFAFRWKLNDGPWSSEVALADPLVFSATMFENARPITLSNLVAGTYTVSVVGKNSAGSWQDTNSPTRSRTWSVQSESTPQIDWIARTGDSVTIHFQAKAATTYSVLYRDNLDPAHPWTKLEDVAAPLVDTAVEITDSGIDARTTRYYQLVTPAQ